MKEFVISDVKSQIQLVLLFYPNLKYVFFKTVWAKPDQSYHFQYVQTLILNAIKKIQQ